MTKSSPSPTAFNQKHRFTLSGWLVRIVLYSCVTASLLLPNYDFKCNGWFGFCTHSPQETGILNLDNTNSRSQKAYYQAEAKTNINRINQALQADYLKSGHFARSIADLELKLNTETASYDYHIVSPMRPVPALNVGKSTTEFPQSIIVIAQAQHPELKHYLGAVFATQVEGTDEMTLLTKVCAVNSNTLPRTFPKLINGTIYCPPSE